MSSLPGVRVHPSTVISIPTNKPHQDWPHLPHEFEFHSGRQLDLHSVTISPRIQTVIRSCHTKTHPIDNVLHLQLSDHNSETQINNFLFKVKLEVLESKIKMTFSLKQHEIRYMYLCVRS